MKRTATMIAPPVIAQDLETPAGARKRITLLVVTGSYAPDSTGIAPLNTEMCEYLVAHGHSVTVATGFPHYPEWRVPEPYRGLLRQREKRGGVTIERRWIWVPSRRTPVLRILYDTSVGLAVGLGSLATPRPQLVLGISPPLQGALAAWAIARYHRVPFVLQVKDLVPDIAIALGMLRNRTAIQTARALERFVYRHADRIWVICEGFRRHLLSLGTPEHRISAIPDWVDTDFVHPGADGAEFRRAHNLETRKIVLHSGNMGAKQNLDTVLGAAERLIGFPDVAICLAGDGAEKSRLQARAASRRLTNVHFLPLTPRAALPGMLAAADMLVLSQSAAIRDVVAPSKLLTYLASGRPILAAVGASSETARTLAQSGGGVIVEPESPASLAEAILSLCSRPERSRQLGLRGRQFAERHFSSTKVLARLEAELLSCAFSGQAVSNSSDHLVATGVKAGSA